jgi:hypothetical protein
MTSSRSKFLTPLLLLIFLYLWGCTSTSTVKEPSLLEQDYTRMNDTQLITYEQQLNDELTKTTRSSSGDVSVGIGFGSWGNSGGFGVSADRRVGGAEENFQIKELRDRRDAVRTEMRRRGLLQ